MRKIKNDELNRLSVDAFISAEKIPVIVVLDNIRSLNNIGSIFRTADSFRVHSMFLCGITGQPPHREIQKTALGATESVQWVYFHQVREAVLKLKKDKYRIIAVEQVDTSIPLEDFNPEPAQKLAFIFGNEISGISEEVLELVDQCIEIPQFGTKHSFNVAVSAGIILWHYHLVSKK